MIKVSVKADVTIHYKDTLDSVGTLLHKPKVHCQL